MPQALPRVALASGSPLKPVQPPSTGTLCFALAHLAHAIAVSTLVVEQGVSLHRLMGTRASRNTSPRSKSPSTIMQSEPSPSVPGVDTLTFVIEERTSEHIRSALSALELRISEQIQASNTALLA
jgi:hypothetical protein